jgi:hypothetical protein
MIPTLGPSLNSNSCHTLQHRLPNLLAAHLIDHNRLLGGALIGVHPRPVVVH